MAFPSKTLSPIFLLRTVYTVTKLGTTVPYKSLFFLQQYESITHLKFLKVVLFEEINK